MPWANNQHAHRQAQAVIMASKHTLTRLIEVQKSSCINSKLPSILLLPTQSTANDIIRLCLQMSGT